MGVHPPKKGGIGYDPWPFFDVCQGSANLAALCQPQKSLRIVRTSHWYAALRYSRVRDSHSVQSFTFTFAKSPGRLLQFAFADGRNLPSVKPGSHFEHIRSSYLAVGVQKLGSCSFSQCVSCDSPFCGAWRVDFLGWTQTKIGLQFGPIESPCQSPRPTRMSTFTS